MSGWLDVGVADFADALARLPHGPPFRFLTAILELEGGAYAKAVWTVGSDEPFLQGHFPGNPIVPGVLLTEALAQLSGILAATNETMAQGVQGRLAHVDVRFTREVMPPARILLSSSVARILGALHQFDVEANVNGVSVARGSVTLAITSEPQPSEGT